MTESQSTIKVTCPACRSEFAPRAAASIPFDCASCSSKVVGAYCDLELIGTGAMGEVYRARRPDMRDQAVAIKIPKTDDDDSLKRFEREIAASAMLQHENIVRAFDCGEVDGRPFLAMELEDGRLLADLVRSESPLSCKLIGTVLRDVAGGIAHAQRHGVVNRDIKPENILVAPNGRAKILDFGLATIRDLDGSTDRVTGPGIRLGTAAFMAPEQARDPRDVNTAADIYSLGCTACYALIGHAPFRGRLAEIARQHTESPRPSLRDQRPDVPIVFESLIQRMMAVDPNARPTPQAVLTELFDCLPSLPHDTMGIAITEGELIEDGEPMDDEPPPPVDEHNSEAPTVVDGVTIPTGALLPADDVPTGEVLDDSNAIATPTLQDVIHEAERTKVAKKKTRPNARARSKRNRFLATVAGGIVLMAAVWLAARPFLGPPDPETVWKEIQDEYRVEHKWRLVETRLDEFNEKYPDNPHAVEIPFVLAMCGAGRDIFSHTGDAQEGLNKIDAIFIEYRDSKEYEIYTVDFFESLKRLVERLVEQTEKTWRPESLAAAKRAHELLRTVAQAMPDDWVPNRVSDLQESIRSAEKQLQVVLAKREVLALLGSVISDEVASDVIDQAYEEAKAVRARHPQLASDGEISAAFDAAYDGEAARVSYEPFDESDAEVAGPPIADDDETVFVVWDEPTDTSAETTTSVFLALADGVLYAFDETGRHLWSHRLGIDSDQLPIALKPSATSPDAVIAVSSVDNTLVAIASKTGRVLWRYYPGAENALAASLTVSSWRPAPNKPARIRGLIPTENGELHVLELVRGKRIGRFKTNVPMTVGGTFDPATQLLFFPADNKRVYALDPAVIEAREKSDGAVRSVLFTNHLSGSLRSRPVVVGQYMLLTELLDLENTQVRAFEIYEPDGFLKPDAPAARERQLHGWSWFTSPVTPDRMTIVTDSGELGVLGLNLDNREEALYPLIHDGTGKSPSLAINVPYRAMAIHSDEHLLWAMAGGTLRQISLDVLDQKVHTLWPESDADAQVVGMPLHDAAFDRETERIYLTTRSLDATHSDFSCVDANSGDKLWSRQVGVHPVGDPIVEGDIALLIDSSGRSLQLAVDASNGDTGSLATIADEALLDVDRVGDLMRLLDVNGQEYAALPVDSGRAVAIRPISANRPVQAAWQTIAFPAAQLQGRPAVAGGYLIAPCSNGSLYRMPLEGAPPRPRNEQTYAWAPESSLAPDDHAAVYPLATDRVVLIVGNSIRWLEYGIKDAVGQWHQLAEAIAPTALRGTVTVAGAHLFAGGGKRALFRMPVRGSNADPDQWPLPGSLTDGPFLVDGKLFVVVDGRQLIAFAPDHPEPLWVAGPFGGRIRGQPVPLGRTLLVTDASGTITGVRSETGQVVGEMHLRPGAVPIAAATPLGKRLLVPLVDGTLAWLDPRNSRAEPRPKPNAAKTGDTQ